MFNENSGLVNLWVSLVKNTDSGYTFDDVPNLLNLRDVVASLL